MSAMEEKKGKTNHIGIVVAAHAPLGTALVKAAGLVLGEEESKIRLIGVDLALTNDPTESINALEQAIRKVRQGGPVLVLADLFGGTAANLALSQLGQDVGEVVTGANLAMVVTACNKRDQVNNANELAKLAVQGAQDSMAIAGAFLKGQSGTSSTDDANAQAAN